MSAVEAVPIDTMDDLAPLRHRVRRLARDCEPDSAADAVLVADTIAAATKQRSLTATVIDLHVNATRTVLHIAAAMYNVHQLPMGRGSRVLLDCTCLAWGVTEPIDGVQITWADIRLLRPPPSALVGPAMRARG